MKVGESSAARQRLKVLRVSAVCADESFFDIHKIDNLLRDNQGIFRTLGAAYSGMTKRKRLEAKATRGDDLLLAKTNGCHGTSGHSLKTDQSLTRIVGTTTCTKSVEDPLIAAGFSS